MSKVTILIPVYNAEPFLRKCLDSLLAQSYQNWQAVCVDDASTDGSLFILNEYANEDHRFVVIHSAENKGLAKTRNTALTYADGDYICMLDADDWFSDDALSKAVAVLDACPQTDCVLFRFVLVYPDGRQEDFPMVPFDKKSGAEVLRLSLDWDVHGIYMVRGQIQHDYPYDDTCRVYSDENTTRLHYAVSREVRCCEGIYYYRQHLQSVTHRVSVGRFDILKAKESLLSSLKALGIDHAILRHVELQLWLALVDCCMFYHIHGRELTKEQRRYGLSEIRRVWQQTDTSCLTDPCVRKFGYRPMSRWWLFRAEEWLYFSLRALLGRNQEQTI